MRILDRYIARMVAVHTATVLGVILSLYIFSAFVVEMDDVGKGQYTFSDAVLFVVKLIPRQIYEVFPMVALLGSILGLGALASTSELTVMRAAGVSIRRLTFSVLKVGALMVLFITLIGEVVAPPLEKSARIDRAKAMQRNITVNTTDGLWAREENTFINIQHLLADGVASSISIYRMSADHRLEEADYAVKGVFEAGHWQLQGVRQSLFLDDRVESRFLPSMSWESSLKPSVFNLVAVPPENLSAYDLFHYVVYLRSNGLESTRYEVAFWVRVITPFATAGMILMAVPFVFGSLRTVGVGQRIMVGALLGVVFYMFNAIFNRFGVVYNVPPFFSATLPTFIVFGIWFYLMRRVK